MENKNIYLSRFTDNEWKQINKRVFEYVQEHPDVSVNMITQGTGLEHSAVFHATETLKRQQYLQLRVVALGNQRDPNSSNFYSASKKEYIEK